MSVNPATRDACLALCIPSPSAGELLCWHCCHPFESVSIPLPISYDGARDAWTVVGHFCSWGCAKAYNTDSRHVRQGERGMLLARLKFRVFGKYVPTVPSPPRQCLRAFGGTMSIEEFREKSPLGIVVSRLPPRMAPLESIVSQRTVEPSPWSHQRAGDMSKPSSNKKNETLRLKRDKPLPSEKTMGLERSMGLECFLVKD